MEFIKKLLRKKKEFDELVNKLTSPEKISEASLLLKELKMEIEKITKNLDEDPEKYSSLPEYYAKKKDDFKDIETALNRDAKTTKTTVMQFLSIMFWFVQISEIPILEMKNYKRLVTILLLTVIFFIVYTIEIWIH